MAKTQMRRLLATAAVLCYACAVVALVFLPLPGPDTRPPSQTIQLLPFQWLADVGTELRNHALSLWHAFGTAAFESAAQNVLLFVPLGVFARMLWKRGLIGTTLLGFACSLLIELTQLTANWGTAPFEYRIFDVDDLMTNTAGAALGWIAGALFLALRRQSAATRSAVGAEAVGHERVDLAKAR